MKKVFNLLVSFVLIAGFSACSKDDSGNQQQETEYPSPTPVPSADYKGLAFISSGESTVRLAQVGTPYEISLEYSTDESHWKPYTIGETITLADSTFLLFRSGEHKNRKFSKDDENYYHFEISGPISAQGNIMSLLNRDFSTPLTTYAFFALFEGCTSLLSAPELPATKMEAYCYNGMFANCTSLKFAPELPAKRLESNCYHCMFERCTSLTSAPELPTTELVSNCYEFMYKDCRNLRYVIGLFTTEPSKKTTEDWLSGVAASGTFIKSEKATWDVTGVHGIPEGWKIETW